MAEGFITSQETRIILAMLVFALLWVIFVIPFLSTSSQFQSLIPPFQYIIFNLGYILISVVTFGTLFSIMTNKSYNFKKAVIYGLSLWFSFSLIFDMWQPPFAIDQQGNDVVLNNSSLINASVDKSFVYLFNTFLPTAKTTVIPIINYSLLYILVYGFVPILGVIIAAIGLSNGAFMKLFKQTSGVHHG